MGVIVPSYAYTYVKLGFLKRLIIDDNVLKQLNNIKDIKQFISIIKPYFPDTIFKEFTIEEIEKALIDFFIKLIGKIIFFSPENMRIFLRDYLIKFEIFNVKRIILGSILGMSMKEKSKKIHFIVEKYLNNTDFINLLIEKSTLKEIQLLMKGTKYDNAVREGILYFRNYNEIFVLNAFLDQIYYRNLAYRIRRYNVNERLIIEPYISSITEIYNINIIYRGILNKIDKNLLSQFLVYNFLFLNHEKLLNLLYQESLEAFFSYLNKYLKKLKDRSRNNYKYLFYEGVNPIKILTDLYQNYYFKQLKFIIGDIERLTIFRIVEILIKKEREIKFFLLPKIVDIIHEKYSLLDID
ncbi:MAG: V-type ATPase subunit [Promethearchaeota archaeon]